MLSIFPELLSYSLLGVSFLRLIVGVTLGIISVEVLFIKREDLIAKISKRGWFFAKYSLWLLGATSLLSALFMIIGFLVQPVAIISAYLFLNIMYLDSGKNKVLSRSNLFYISMALISLTLLFLGPGIFSVDLPL